MKCLTLKQTSKGICFVVRIQPNAKANMLYKVENGILFIKVHAAPIDNAANHALSIFLSELFEIPKTNLLITKGHKSRIKTVSIIHQNLEHVNRKLQDFLAKKGIKES